MASSRSLHTVHLAAFGAGNVVGLGVMSMAGIGVGITGTGLWLAALVGGLGGAFALVPQLLASSSGDYPGGQYQQVGTLARGDGATQLVRVAATVVQAKRLSRGKGRH